MPATRGTKVGVYTTDSGVTYNTNVDPDNFANTDAGWTAGSAPLNMPRRFKPRHATGKDASGRHHTIILPDVANNLWTRVANSWDGQDDIGGTYTAQVINLINEKPSL